MELDEYKSMIKIRAKSPVPVTPSAALERFRRKRTHSVVKKIKNSLWLETAFAFVFQMLSCYLVIVSASIYLQFFAIIMLAFCVYFIYYLSKLFVQIQEQEVSLLPVSATLEQLVGIIGRFVRLYFQLTMVVMPFVFILAFVIGYLNSGANSDVTIFPFREFRLYFGVSLGWVVMMYFFTKWYIRKMYGNYLEKLTRQLQELQTMQ